MKTTGRARELALTARTFSGAEALQMGLVTHVFPDEAALQVGDAGCAHAKFQHVAVVQHRTMLSSY